MGGSQYDDDWVLPSADITLVLVGKLGYGKSATGNSILGREAFVSEYSHASVTNTCQMGSTILKDGRTINVIDTPGLFDMTISSEDAGKEIVKCMNMAKDGIHAVLMVFSATSRFSREDSNTIETIKVFFGEKIVDHMILVFTYGDLVGETKLKNMLNNAPEYLQKIVELCKNRVVLFDNMTKDRRLQAKQLEKLLDVVDSVSANNGGKPFSDQVLTRIKEVHDREKEVRDAMGYTEEQISELKEEIHRTRDEQLAPNPRRIRSSRGIDYRRVHMKFGKDFRNHLEETLPTWRDKYLAYKALKKLIKSLPPEGDHPPAAAPVGDGNRAVGDWFAGILDLELHKLNDFYMEREEWYVIRLQVLKERIERVKAKKNDAFTSKSEFTEEMLDIRKAFVIIHGEMILLQTYSSLNFAGLVKILKKYDKRTGGLLSLPFTQRARHQPFFTTEPLTRLVRECEVNLELLFPVEAEVLESGSSAKLQPHNDVASGDPTSSCDVETSDVYRSTLAAMKAIQGLRKASSTYNPLSLARFFHGEDGEACSGAITSESSLSDSLTDSQVQGAEKDDKEVQSKEQNAAQIERNVEGEPLGE